MACREEALVGERSQEKRCCASLALYSLILAPWVKAQCTFASPYAPHGPTVTVESALVDTGSSDCELRAELLQQLKDMGFPDETTRSVLECEQCTGLQWAVDTLLAGNRQLDVTS